MSLPKILITGSNGLLGQKLIYNLLSRNNFEVHACAKGENRLLEKRNYTYHSIDITNEEAVGNLISGLLPEVIINTAAMTNVDACEQNKEACWDVNTNAVAHFIKHLEKAQETNQAYQPHFIHLSTDFVFDGTKGPYKETDEPNPQSYYAESKLASEKLLMSSTIKWSIVRTIIVYGIVDNMSRSNIILWVKGALEKGDSINVINDQFRSPTLAEDLAEGCILIAEKMAEGIYHLSGPDTYCILDLAYMVADFWELDKSLITPISSASLNQPAKRPPVTGFDISKAKRNLGYNPKTFEEGLKFVADQIEQRSK